MRKLLCVLLLTALLAVLLTACGDKSGPTGSLNVYTSMKDSLIMTLVDDFVAKNPDIIVDIKVAGAGTLMSQIEDERKNGKIIADVLWTSEIPDFYYMKNEGLLLHYTPAGAENIRNPLNNTDGYFFPARLGTMGIAYNTQLVSTPPASWHDLLGPEFANGFAIADPSTSGTALMGVAMLKNAFGTEFFHDLKANGATIGQGSSQVIEAVATGELAACLAVDYITFDKAATGAPIALAYPPEMIVIPSPVAIFKDSVNLENAKKFTDYLISQDAQKIIASTGTLPILDGVTVPKNYNIPPVAEAMARIITIDNAGASLLKDGIVDMLLNIMR